jgi:hypothetical protein
MASDCICPLLMLDFSRLLVNTSQVLPVQPCPCQTRRSERWLLSLRGWDPRRSLRSFGSIALDAFKSSVVFLMKADCWASGVSTWKFSSRGDSLTRTRFG